MILKEIESLLFLNPQNRRVFIVLGFEELFLQLVDKLSTQFLVPFTNQNLCYVQNVITVLQRLLEYGVDLRQNKNIIHRILVSAAQKRGKQHLDVGHIFTKSIINILNER